MAILEEENKPMPKVSKSSVSDDYWITPMEAVKLITHYAGNDYLAKQVIADGLRSEQIDAGADYFWEVDDDDISGDWVPTKKDGLFYEEDVEISREVWQDSEGWPDDVANWRWASGEFVLFAERRDSDWPQTFFIKGVMLRRRDVLALVGRSDRKGVGGRPPDRARWDRFWTSILYEATKAPIDWTEIDTRYKLKQRLLLWSADEFSENNINSAVKAIWEHVVLRIAADRQSAADD